MNTKSQKNNNSNKQYPSEDNTKVIDMLYPMLDNSIDEMREFAKKKPDEPLNMMKIGILNRLMKSIKEALSIDPCIEYLDYLDKDNIPSNSDALLILVNYKAAISQYKNKYYGYDGSKHRWFTTENPPHDYHF